MSITRNPIDYAGVQALVENPAMARFVKNEQRSTIAELELAHEEQRDALDPVTVAALESNPRIIDAAVARTEI